MQKHYLKTLAISASALATLTLGGVSAQATTLQEIFAQSAQGNKHAQASQVKIDKMSDQTAKLLQDYKNVLKTVEGLRVYNAQLQRQIDNQNKEKGELRASIERVTLIERQITPLMIRMIDGLDNFVALDVPFHADERAERLTLLKETMERADVSPSEKFRRVFEAYQIEVDYGRSQDAYSGTLDIPGAGIREVSFLRVGRTSLMYQTKDASLQGVWNNTTRQWIELDSSFSSSIAEGLKIANSQTSPNLYRIPVFAPGK